MSSVFREKISKPNNSVSEERFNSDRSNYSHRLLQDFFASISISIEFLLDSIAMNFVSNPSSISSRPSPSSPSLSPPSSSSSSLVTVSNQPMSSQSLPQSSSSSSSSLTSATFSFSNYDLFKSSSTNLMFPLESFEDDPGINIGHITASYNDYIILLSGFKGYRENSTALYRSSDEIWIYDQLMEKWIKKICTTETNDDDMPIERSSACATIIENFLYLFGGFSEEGNLNTLNRLNLSTLKWSRLRPNGREPLPCDKNIGWEYDGNFYLFGGYGPVPRIWSEDFPFQFIFDNSSHWHYVRGWNNQLVYYDREMNCWQWPNHHGDIPSARAACAAAKIGHLLYLFGGRVNQDRMNDMYVLNLRSYRWKQIQCNDLDYPISGRSWHTLTQTSERFLILYGGFSHNNQPLNDCWLFDIQTNVWREIILPTRKPRFWHTATLSSFNEILILGGAIEELNVTFHRNPKYNHIFAKNIFTIQLEPKSLFRQCLNVIANSLPLTENLINSLPRCLIEIVLKRCLTNTNLNRLCYLLNHNSFALSLNVSK